MVNGNYKRRTITKITTQTNFSNVNTSKVKGQVNVVKPIAIPKYQLCCVRNIVEVRASIYRSLYKLYIYIHWQVSTQAHPFSTHPPQQGVWPTPDVTKPSRTAVARNENTVLSAFIADAIFQSTDNIALTQTSISISHLTPAVH